MAEPGETDPAAGERRLRRAGLALLAFLIALPWLADAAGVGFYTDLSAKILVFALAAVSLDLILGYGGLVSLASRLSASRRQCVAQICSSTNSTARNLVRLPHGSSAGGLARGGAGRRTSSPDRQALISLRPARLYFLK